MTPYVSWAPLIYTNKVGKSGLGPPVVLRHEPGFVVVMRHVSGALVSVGRLAATKELQQSIMMARIVEEDPFQVRGPDDPKKAWALHADR